RTRKRTISRTRTKKKTTTRTTTILRTTTTSMRTMTTSRTTTTMTMRTTTRKRKRTTTRISTHQARRRQRGVALILVLWTLAALAVLAAEFARAMHDEAASTRNFKEST